MVCNYSNAPGNNIAQRQQHARSFNVVHILIPTVFTTRRTAAVHTSTHTGGIRRSTSDDTDVCACSAILQPRPRNKACHIADAQLSRSDPNKHELGVSEYVLPQCNTLNMIRTPEQDSRLNKTVSWCTTFLCFIADHRACSSFDLDIHSTKHSKKAGHKFPSRHSRVWGLGFRV